MRTLVAVAVVNAIVHVAGLGAALLMRPGTPLVPLHERTAWLQRDPIVWTIGWSVWIACAIAFVALALALGRRVASAGRRAAGYAAIAMAAIAAATDIGCDLRFIALPSRAGDADFVAIERTLNFVGQVIANGLYSVVVLILAFAIDGAWQRRIGIATFVCGLGIVAAGVTGDGRILAISTGPTVIAFSAWGILAARALGGRA
jgi:hypothetical protein